ncbi:hypothetical protein KP509_04G022000 [Ceratopteris richardii]|uniref:Uncharacterized protein n=1 Tax=Ceratopteris richardii TaxID=49495 RepID=A0A8T2UR09_CERRI|nr:hypothetical protein KP509_04G022000 [Ceratopteris richardii]
MCRESAMALAPFSTFRSFIFTWLWLYLCRSERLCSMAIFPRSSRPIAAPDLGVSLPEILLDEHPHHPVSPSPTWVSLRSTYCSSSSFTKSLASADVEEPCSPLFSSPAQLEPFGASRAVVHEVSKLPLDPIQLRALRELGINVGVQACTDPSLHDAITCDDGDTVRHVVALRMELCSRGFKILEEPMAELAKSLRALFLVDCPVQAGRMPAKLLNSLKSLTWVATVRNMAAENLFTVATVPAEWICDFRNLSELTMANIHLSGSPLPCLVRTMKNLKHLDLSSTSLTGQFPSDPWPMTLRTLFLPSNALSGLLPPSLTQLHRLTHLDLSHNQLSGALPDSFHTLVSIMKIDLSFNALIGRFPSSLLNLSSLVYLDMSHNKLSGPIPAQINGMTSLRYLDISNNNFKGKLPFKQSFLDRLNTLKVSGISDICYDHYTLSSPFLEGLPRCDVSGLPIVPSMLSPALPPHRSAFAPSQLERNAAPPGLHHHRPPRVMIAAVSIAGAMIVLSIVVVLVVTNRKGGRY